MGIRLQSQKVRINEKRFRQRNKGVVLKQTRRIDWERKNSNGRTMLVSDKWKH